MIFLFTDFSLHGPYVGQMKTVLARQAPGMPVIDLMHDAPAFNPRASAYLLASLTPLLPANSVTVAVVDPGVGDDRRQPCVVEVEDKWYVGPNNGLFNVVANRGRGSRIWQIDWRPEVLSHSFHGRDLFAPMAARIAGGNREGLSPTRYYGEPTEWPADLAQIIYIDGFGNGMTGLRACEVEPSTQLVCKGMRFAHGQTFSSVAPGEGFWYENSNGLVELAINRGNLARQRQLGIGEPVEVSPDGPVAGRSDPAPA